MKRLFEPGDLVADLVGKRGIVLSLDEFFMLTQRFRPKSRPGSFFAVGCNPAPEYITKIPVFFEDESISIMRPLGIRKILDDQIGQRLKALVLEFFERTKGGG